MTGGLNGGVHVTDVSTASRTMLMNLKSLDRDKPTLDTLTIPAEILPKIVSNSEIIGMVGKGWYILGLPIFGCLDDQNATMQGQACRKGEAKSTYGTRAFILLNTAPTNYALEGSVAIAGAAVQQLRDRLGMISIANALSTSCSSKKEEILKERFEKHQETPSSAIEKSQVLLLTSNSHNQELLEITFDKVPVN
ncbi:glycerol kinase-like [Vitis vinifera]|uniref:glycerol kinase-like n=1 Tax=Vitis vinifera TaxID=29760 RepID=UPI0028831155|nr:glycerol kinase-like [Vitis vinifera]